MSRRPGIVIRVKAPSGGWRRPNIKTPNALFYFKLILNSALSPLTTSVTRSV
jgi:hypothetical protein